MEVDRNVRLRSKANEAAIISIFVAARRAPVPADLSLPRRRVSGTLSAASLAVDREEFCISIFVKRHVRRRAEWTVTQLDTFSEMQRPASPHGLIFRALGHRRLHPVRHTKELRLGAGVHPIAEPESKRANVRNGSKADIRSLH